jgi:DNA-binding NarL/FixJ family response regulator
VRILVADDHEIVRAGVRAILQSRLDMEIVGEAVNGQEAVAEAAQLNRHLIILDRTMPLLSGLGAAAQIRRFLPNVPMLMLSMHDGEALLQAVRSIGAQGFVPKAECGERLLEGIDTVARGGLFFKDEPSSRMGLSH